MQRESVGGNGLHHVLNGQGTQPTGRFAISSPLSVVVSGNVGEPAQVTMVGALDLVNNQEPRCGSFRDGTFRSAILSLQHAEVT